MKPYMVSDSNIQDIIFLRYNVTTIIVMWKRMKFLMP